MAEIQNNITNSTQVQFQICPLKTNLGTPAAGNIVFIKDTNELYLDGTYYGLSTADAAALEKAVTDISGLTSTVTQHLTVTKDLMTYVANLRKFADGATANSTTGPVLITRPEGVLKGKDNVKAAIDALAAAVDTLNAKVWTAVNKPGKAAKFATSVTQGTDGSIKVTYNDAMSTDVKRDTTQQNSIAGATVEAALETLKGQAAAAQAKANANETAIGVINGTDAGSISKAVSDAKSELIGTGEGVWAEDELQTKTLTKLRELIKANTEQIKGLTGVDSETLNKLTAIVNELKNADGTATGIDLANTLLDKFLALYGHPEDGKFTANGSKHTTLQEIIYAIEKRITTVNTTLSNSLTSTIQGLDATVEDHLTVNDEVEDNNHVGVKVIEENGKLTGVTVVEKDIASAASLNTLTATVTELSEKVENQGSQLTWTVIS